VGRKNAMCKSGHEEKDFRTSLEPNRTPHTNCNKKTNRGLERTTAYFSVCQLNFLKADHAGAPLLD
jgi:hypothetical protein